MQMKIWTLITALTLVSGCVSHPKPDAPAPSLEGQWMVEDINNGGVIDNSYLTLNVSGATVSGSAGCNNFTGSLTQTASTLSISQLALTRKMCPPALMQQEQRYMQALGSITTLKQSATKPWVFLTADDADIRLKLVNTQADTKAAAHAKQDNQSLTRHPFSCDNLGEITMSFVGPETITLNLPDESLVMKRERSASGARYVSAQSYFWNQGDTATLAYQDTRYKCVKLEG